jgi:hypothetical protein
MSEEDTIQAFNKINECLEVLANRLIALEQRVAELPTPDKTYYKPIDGEEYLNIKGNYDEIYRRIRILEGTDGL